MRSSFLRLLPALLLVVSCSSSKPATAIPAASSPRPPKAGPVPASSSTLTQRDGRNNVVNQRVQNSRVPTGKGRGSGSIRFTGSNNIVDIEITDSDIASFGSKSVTIIEGDNNHLTFSSYRCVLSYKGRTDTLLVTGRQLTIDFAAANVVALVEGPGATQQISAASGSDDVRWVAWEPTDSTLAQEEIFVAEVQQYMKLREAFRYYLQQAQAGNYQAMYMLGRYFDDLTFTAPTHILQAMQYYDVAARHDHPEAALRLAHLYEVGEFEHDQVPLNRVKAQYYYTLAAKNGSELARQKLAAW